MSMKLAIKTQIPAQSVQCSNLIGGQWQAGTAGKIDILSPYTGKSIGQISIPNSDQIQAAIESAHRAHGDWAATPVKERSKVLYRFREILHRDLDLITHLKSSESGKTFEEARAGLMKGVEVLEYALSIQNLDLGGKLEVSRGVYCEFRRESLGVVASISPFNFPAMVPLWTIPISLVLGNSVVWKPSEKTPLTSSLIGAALVEAGIPAGVFTILQGAAETSRAILDHPKVKAISFVGSTKVARDVYVRGTSQGKRVLALGGAKNHIVLLPDANEEMSGVGISDSFTGCAGQRCMAASVLLAVGNVDLHLTKIVERAQSMQLGLQMGALISAAQKQFLLAAIDRAEKAGAKILLDGRKSIPPMGFEGGNWLGATILDHVKPGSEAATVELFGPILSIIRCEDLSEALRIQKTSEYGNACSVFTTSGPLADRVVREAKAGMVGVNVGVPVPREPFSFGGVDLSKFGTGDITGERSLDFWTQIKKITTKWEPQKESNWMS